MKQWLSAEVPGEGEVGRWEWVKHTGLHLWVLSRRQWRGEGGVVVADWSTWDVHAFDDRTRECRWPLAEAGVRYPATWDVRGGRYRALRYQSRDRGLWCWWLGLRGRCVFRYGCTDGGRVRLPVVGGAYGP